MPPVPIPLDATNVFEKELLRLFASDWLLTASCCVSYVSTGLGASGALVDSPLPLLATVRPLVRSAMR